MRLVNLYKILESSFDCPNPLPNMNHHNLSPSIQTFWYKIYNCMSTEAHMSISDAKRIIEVKCERGAVSEIHNSFFLLS